MKPSLKVVPWHNPPVKIDKNIPYPNKKYRGADPRYPWRIMEVGDSFPVPLDVNIEGFSCVIAQAQRAIPGRKFSYRKVDEEGCEYRCWRIA